MHVGAWVSCDYEFSNFLIDKSIDECSLLSFGFTLVVKLLGCFRKHSFFHTFHTVQYNFIKEKPPDCVREGFLMRHLLSLELPEDRQLSLGALGADVSLFLRFQLFVQE